MRKSGDGRSISRQALEQHRFRALELRKKKWKVKDIAESFGLHRGSVSRWLTKAKRKGPESLKRTKAKGAKPKLEAKHDTMLLQQLKKPATEFGFETPLWTCKRVKQLISKKFNISLSVSNVWKWLRKLGLTSQKPERRALEADPQAASKWLREEWPRIKAHARRWQAMLYFQDESGVRLIPTVGRTWAPKGQTPVVKVTGKKGGLCVSSAISPAGRLLFRVEKDTVTAVVFIDFLKKILAHHPRRKIIVVADKARPHIAKAVSNFAKRNSKRFAIYYLPSYSAELNPDEEVWNDLKTNRLKAHQAQTIEELKFLIGAKMRSIQRKPDMIKAFFIKAGVT